MALAGIYAVDESLITSKSAIQSGRGVLNYSIVQMGNAASIANDTSKDGSPRTSNSKKWFTRKPTASTFPSGYNPHMFTITAYLPYDGGKRLKVGLCLLWVGGYRLCCYIRQTNTPLHCCEQLYS